MDKQNSDRTPYTYFIKWSHLNKWYYGLRYAKGCHPDEFWVNYFTSSRHVKSLLESHGDPDIVQVRKTFKDIEKAIEWERKVLIKMNVLHRDDSLNMNVAGSIVIPNEIYSEIVRKRKQSMPDGFSRGEKNPMFGKMWITDGTNSKVISRDEIIPKGWCVGRKINPQFQKNCGSFSKNTIWITNGINNKRIKPDVEIPDGWWKGHSVKNKDSIRTSYNTVWITNGKQNKKNRKNVPIPDGWWKGFTKSKSGVLV